jgi:chromosome segregation ATPase
MGYLYRVIKMVSEIILFEKEERADSYILTIENIEKKLFTSKNEIQQLKSCLSNYSNEKIHFMKQIEKINMAAKVVQINPVYGQDMSITNSTSHEKRLQFEQSLTEIRHQMKKVSANENKLKKDLKKKAETIQHFNIMKNSYWQEMTDYRQTIQMYERSTEHFSQALEESKQIIKDHLLEAERKTQDMAKSFEEERSQFIKKIEKQEQTFLNYQQHETILQQKLEEKNQYIHSLQQEVNKLKKM